MGLQSQRGDNLKMDPRGRKLPPEDPTCLTYKRFLLISRQHLNVEDLREESRLVTSCEKLEDVATLGPRPV